MGIRKSTRVQEMRLIHVWDDVEIGFHAEVFKRDWTWSANSTTDEDRMFAQYQSAVDYVMDAWRLAKSGYHSWEEAGATLAGDQGKEWEALSDDEMQDYLDAARMSARVGAL